jgi:hypothetical protein
MEIFLTDNDAFENFTFEDVARRLDLVTERVAQNKYSYDTKVADENIRKRFYLKNFSEVEILGKFKLGAEACYSLKNTKQESDSVPTRPEYLPRDAFFWLAGSLIIAMTSPLQSKSFTSIIWKRGRSKLLSLRFP